MTVKDWVLGGGTDQMSKLTDDFTAVGDKTVDLRTGCVAIQQDVESAQAYPPIPDALAQADWAASLAAFARGATDCISGVDTHSSTVIRRATSEFQQGNVKLTATIDRLNALAP
jgi:hypothetical protein